MGDSGSVGAGSSTGIHCYQSDDLDLSWNWVHHSGYAGIEVQGSSWVTITHNHAEENQEYGIRLYNQAHNNTIAYNNASNNHGDGIYVNYECHDNTLTANNVTGNDDEGIEVNDDCYRIVVQDNFVTDSGDEGLYLRSDSHNATITRNYLSGNQGVGLYIYQRCENVVATRNNASDNGEYGIYVRDRCHAFELVGNIVGFNRGTAGLRVYDEITGGTIRENNVSWNADDGIYVRGPSWTYKVSEIAIEDNHATYNGRYGICAADYTGNCTLTRNLAWNNTHTGIYLSANTGDHRAWWNFVGKNFVDQAWDGGSDNAWASGTAGNYWRDYQAKYPAATHNGQYWQTPYAITGPATNADPYPQAYPWITHPADLSFPFNATGYAIAWTIRSVVLEPTYTIYANDSVNATGKWAFNAPVTHALDAFNLSTGVYNFTIVARDGDGGVIQDEVWVNVGGNQAPTVTRPANMVYTVNTTGHAIAWTPTDLYAPAPSYSITRNGTAVATGTWTSGGPVATSVDGLTAGTYHYVITLHDGAGGSVQDEVIVTVVLNLPPAVSQPPDVSYTRGTTGHAITWVITDAHTSGTPSYLVYRDGAQASAGTWTSGVPVTVNIDGLLPGTYVYQIHANDGLGGVGTDSVTVLVLSNNTAPTVTHPGDVEFHVGQHNVTITWVANDTTLGLQPTYAIYINGSTTANATGAWTPNASIVVDVTSFNLTLVNNTRTWYNFTIVVFDGVDAYASDSVMVAVSPAPGPNVGVWIVVGVALGIGVTIVVLVVVMKRKQGRP